MNEKIKQGENMNKIIIKKTNASVEAWNTENQNTAVLSIGELKEMLKIAKATKHNKNHDTLIMGVAGEIRFAGEKDSYVVYNRKNLAVLPSSWEIIQK